jgi:signal peptidase I
LSLTAGSNIKRKSIFREYAEAIIIALLLALFVREFLVQAFKIPSGSMIPTLLIGDHILVNKFIYGIKMPFTGRVIIPVKEPARNDIVVFKYPRNPSQDYIKRVIGLPGDTIEIINKKIYINGNPLANDYGIFLDNRIMNEGPRDNFGPVTVPPHSLFVMGDNRDNSADSRFWRFVDYRDIKGKAFILYWSWNSEDFSVRWNRIGDLLE